MSSCYRIRLFIYAQRKQLNVQFKTGLKKRAFLILPTIAIKSWTVKVLRS